MNDKIAGSLYIAVTTLFAITFTLSWMIGGDIGFWSAFGSGCGWIGTTGLYLSTDV